MTNKKFQFSRNTCGRHNSIIQSDSFLVLLTLCADIETIKPVISFEIIRHVCLFVCRKRDKNREGDAQRQMHRDLLEKDVGWKSYYFLSSMLTLLEI